MIERPVRITSASRPIPPEIVASRGLATEDQNLHAAAAMSKQPLLFLAGLAVPVLALTVLGCRNDDRTNRPDETNAPPMPAPNDTSPPLVEDDDEIGDEDDVGHDASDAPGSHHYETSPVDPDMPEGADPKQPPPPSHQ